MKKPRTHPSAGTQILGTQMDALKHDVAALMSPFQEAWGEIRKELGSGEKVKAAFKQTGLDKTWTSLKEAAVTVVQPWLPTTRPTKPRRASAKKSVRKAVTKTASKVAKKVSPVKKKAAKKPA